MSKKYFIEDQNIEAMREDCVWRYNNKVWINDVLVEHTYSRHFYRWNDIKIKMKKHMRTVIAMVECGFELNEYQQKIYGALRERGKNG